MRLLVISQSLILRPYQARWRRLAKANPDLQIRLLVPQRCPGQGRQENYLPRPAVGRFVLAREVRMAIPTPPGRETVETDSYR